MLTANTNYIVRFYTLFKTNVYAHGMRRRDFHNDNSSKYNKQIYRTLLASYMKICNVQFVSFNLSMI